MWNCGNWGTGLPFGFGSFLMGFGPFGGLLGVLLFIFLMYLGIRLIMSFIPKANATPDTRRQPFEISLLHLHQELSCCLDQEIFDLFCSNRCEL